VHLALFHAANDPRIVDKECRTLAGAGYDVHVVTGRAAATSTEGITFHSLNLPLAVSGIFQRFRGTVVGVFRAFSAARRLQASVYHLHEVPLIPVGLWLRVFGHRVIYDAHEDAFREKISHGITLGHPLVGWSFAIVALVLEWLAKRMFNGFVAATPGIAARFPRGRTVVVHNFPRVEEYAQGDEFAGAGDYAERDNVAVYVGNLFRNRGAKEMIDAMSLVSAPCDARLVIAGSFTPPALHEQLAALAGWQRVEYLGWQSAAGVRRVLARARVGLAVLHPRPEYLTAYPVKLFEYMAAGLPVIVSDFPLWQRLVEDAHCGLAVDPLQPRAIADALDTLFQDPARATEMGRRGRQAVCEKYNWDSEAAKLLDFYQQLCD